MAWPRVGRFPSGVRSEEGLASDWRDAAAYAPLLKAERSIFAWEWIRRNPAYRAAAERALGGAAGGAARKRLEEERWGLHAFEPPGAAAPDARPMWRAEVHPYVLKVDAVRSVEPSDAFDLARLGATRTITTDSDGREHLLISDGLRSIRVDVLAGSVKEGSVRLHYRLAGFASAERPLLTLRRLLALRRAGRFSAALHPAEARAWRFILLLRAHDAIASGATQREIAAELLSAEAEEPRWRVSAPTLRLRVQRLVRNARAMAAGGYVSLLSD